MRKKVIAAALAAALAPGMALATDGYFSHGYGMKGKGMAGAGMALAHDAFGGANNPATMVWAGDRFDVGLDWFSPNRDIARTGSAAGIDGAVKSDSNDFWIPEFGYNRMLNPRMSLGVTVYGNGGMNTNFPGGQIPAASACASFNPLGAGGAPFNMLCGTGPLGVDLIQLVVAPTVAYKINDNNSIGIAPLLGYQRFKAEGLQGFTGFSQDPTKLTNNGYDSATGYGVRIGWMGKLSDKVSLGAAYSTKIFMSKFDKYAGLFADQGDFDMPENYGVGVAFTPDSKWTIALDYKHIAYSGINSVGNPSTNFGPMPPNSLGPSNGRGFGWDDVNVLKLGIEYQYSSALTLRAGYDRTDNPIQARDVTFNMLAPGVVQDHYTLGFTYTLDDTNEITAAYMHAMENSVSGSSLFNIFGVPAGNETIRMHEDSFGIAWGHKL